MAPERDRGPSLRRRTFVQGALGAGVALSLRGLVPRAEPGAVASGASPPAATPPDVGAFGDLYRRAWRWDRVVRGTHLRANCFSACSFDLYVRDGVVFREEQADVYDRPEAALPDFAPRGCQKGACTSDLMVGADRILHPLERAGPRGSGRFRRISFERAVERLAEAMVDAAVDSGPDTVVFDNGTSNVDDGPHSLGEMRLFTLLGATLLDGFGGTGDLAMGAVQSLGTPFVDGTADDWFRTDLLLLWHCNPVVTRIPDAHFATEARYRGARVVALCPEYSPTAIHSDLHVSPRPGSDAALALGLARGVIEAGAIDRAYVSEQTDLPLLVRDDNGRYLREADLREAGSEEVFYLFDRRTGKVRVAPGGRGNRRGLQRIHLGDLDPALEGSFEIPARSGRVRVRPVFERLREHLRALTPEAVADRTGVAPSVQERLLREILRARRFIAYASWGSNKQYHADLFQRALILLGALRGQHGRPGGGVRFAAWLPLGASSSLLPGSKPSLLQRILLPFLRPGPRDIEDAIARATRESLPWTPSHLFLHAHAGLDEVQDREPRGESLPRPPRAYLDEALARGHARLRPPRERPPRVLVVSGCNPLRRWPLPQRVQQVLWPKLRMIAVIDFRLSTTAAHADLILPAAGYYEKIGIKYVPALAPYAVIGEAAVPPLGESRGEWEICWHLSRALQAAARRRRVRGPLAEIHDRFSEGGRLGPDAAPVLVDRILRESTATRVGLDEARRMGAVRLRTPGGWSTTSGVGADYDEEGVLSPSRVHLEQRQPWPTLTGRQQFYLDHPWFLETGESLPRAKPLPRPGGGPPDQAILLSGGHTRWSIHAIWRNHPGLLRLQRGGPAVVISAGDAGRLGIRDGGAIRVSNRHGAFRARARVAPGMPPGQAFLEHAFEPYQFPGWRSAMDLVSSPYKPLHFAGGYGHLRLRVFQNGPVHVPRAIPVRIEPDPERPG